MADDAGQMRIWKISHGTPRTNSHLNEGGPDGSRADLRLKSLITLHRNTKIQQGHKFRTVMRPGDIFYLCYGNNVQLLGKVASGVLNPLGKWVQRRYETLIPDPKRTKFKGTRKKWAPNGRTTCWQVPQEELQTFERTFLKPFFGLSLRELRRMPAVPPEPAQLGPEVEEIERGAGFQPDSKVRKAVELHAMRMVESNFRKRGYEITDVHASSPYDLLCVKGRKTRFVEVKGAEGNGATVNLTAGEVRFVRENMDDCVLCVVRGISISGAKNPKASGGTLESDKPFDLSKGTLTPIQFRFRRAR